MNKLRIVDTPPAPPGGPCPVAGIAAQLVRIIAALRRLDQAATADRGDVNRHRHESVALEARREVLERLAMCSSATSLPGAALQVMLMADCVATIASFVPEDGSAGRLRVEQLAAEAEHAAFSAVAALEAAGGFDRDQVGGVFYLAAALSPFAIVARHLDDAGDGRGFA